VLRVWGHQLIKHRELTLERVVQFINVTSR
jgi:hypothetical protein